MKSTESFSTILLSHSGMCTGALTWAKGQHVQWQVHVHLTAALHHRGGVWMPLKCTAWGEVVCTLACEYEMEVEFVSVFLLWVYWYWYWLLEECFFLAPECLAGVDLWWFFFEVDCCAKVALTESPWLEDRVSFLQSMGGIFFLVLSPEASKLRPAGDEDIMSTSGFSSDQGETQGEVADEALVFFLQVIHLSDGMLGGSTSKHLLDWWAGGLKGQWGTWPNNYILDVRKHYSGVFCPMPGRHLSQPFPFSWTAALPGSAWLSPTQTCYLIKSNQIKFIAIRKQVSHFTYKHNAR